MEERCNRADLIEVFKITHSLWTTWLSDMIRPDTSGRTRGHSSKLIKWWCNKDHQKVFFLTSGGFKMKFVGWRYCKFKDGEKLHVKIIEKERVKKDGSILWLMFTGPTCHHGDPEWPSCKSHGMTERQDLQGQTQSPTVSATTMQLWHCCKPHLRSVSGMAFITEKINDRLCWKTTVSFYNTITCMQIKWFTKCATVHDSFF